MAATPLELGMRGGGKRFHDALQDEAIATSEQGLKV